MKEKKSVDKYLTLRNFRNNLRYSKMFNIHTSFFQNAFNFIKTLIPILTITLSFVFFVIFCTGTPLKAAMISAFITLIVSSIFFSCMFISMFNSILMNFIDKNNNEHEYIAFNEKVLLNDIMVEEQPKKSEIDIPKKTRKRL